MRFLRRAAIGAALAAAGLAAACTDVPFAPTWDADWTVPLPVAPVRLDALFGTGSVAPLFSAPVDIGVQQQDLGQAIGEVLKQDIERAILKLHFVMTVPLAGADTLFVAASPADLANPAAVRIVLPVALAPTTSAGADVVDTLAAGSPQLAMLQNAAAGGGSGALYLTVRGTIGNPSTTLSVPIASGDEIGLSFQLTVRIPVSK